LILTILNLGLIHTHLATCGAKISSEPNLTVFDNEEIGFRG
jgi:hypothetical protein